MSINSKKDKKQQGQVIVMNVSNRKKTTVPKGIFETEAQKLNNRLVKMIACR